MWLIIFNAGQVSGTEGRYKTVLIARRHLRKLQRRYTETNFNLRKVNKKVKGGF